MAQLFSLGIAAARVEFKFGTQVIYGSLAHHQRFAVGCVSLG